MTSADSLSLVELLKLTGIQLWQSSHVSAALQCACGGGLLVKSTPEYVRTFDPVKYGGPYFMACARFRTANCRMTKSMVAFQQLVATQCCN